MDNQWMTVKEVAEYLRLSPDMIYRLAQRGRIPVSKVGSRWRFKKEKIDQWMDAQEVSGPVDTASPNNAGMKAAW